MFAAAAGTLGMAGATVKAAIDLPPQHNPGNTAQGALPPGHVYDYVDDTLRPLTPEEEVRQIVEQWLVGQGFAKSQIVVEYRVQMGSTKKFIDVGVFPPGRTHHQDNLWIIIECKCRDVPMRKHDAGVAQLKSYMAACPNAEYGMWTNGSLHVVIKKVVVSGHVEYVGLDRFPTGLGHENENLQL